MGQVVRSGDEEVVDVEFEFRRVHADHGRLGGTAF
jgi:hypothetical protein